MSVQVYTHLLEVNNVILTRFPSEPFFLNTGGGTSKIWVQKVLKATKPLKIWASTPKTKVKIGFCTQTGIRAAASLTLMFV